jgi:transposase-like protein
MRYSPERKQAVLAKMQAPQNRSIAELAEQENISIPTLYGWRKEARRTGRLLPNGDKGSSGWSSHDKFAAVLESAPLNEVELSEYCRKKGLYPEQIRQWRAACEQANEWELSVKDRLKAARREDEQRLRELERDLRKKEKALAETAALLVLRKKAQAIWGESEDE